MKRFTAFALALVFAVSMSPAIAFEYQDYSIETRADRSIPNCKIYRIRVKRQDGSTVLNDYTGDNFIEFQFGFTNLTLTRDEQRELVELISNFAIEKRALHME